MNTVTCNLTLQQLDLIQASLNLMIIHGEYNKDVRDTLEFIKCLRIYGKCKSRPENSVTVQGA